MGDPSEEVDLVRLGIFEVSTLDSFFPEYRTAGVVTEVFQRDVVPGWSGQEGWLQSPSVRVAGGDFLVS